MDPQKRRASKQKTKLGFREGWKYLSRSNYIRYLSLLVICYGMRYAPHSNLRLGGIGWNVQLGLVNWNRVLEWISWNQGVGELRWNPRSEGGWWGLAMANDDKKGFLHSDSRRLSVKGQA